MALRPLHDHVVVELDPVKEFSRGGIIKVAPEPVRTGTVLAVGPGRRYQVQDQDPQSRRRRTRFVPTELKVGERIAFFQAVMETQQGAQIGYALPNNQALLRETDALFVIPEGVEVEVSR